MAAEKQYRSRSHSDAEILSAFKNIAAELDQDTEKSRLTVVVMIGLSPHEELPLSGSQNRPFAQHAEQFKTASWESAGTYFRPLHLHVRLDRDWEQGDDRISISFPNNPSDDMDATRALKAVCGHFVPLNQMAAMKRALGPGMAEFYRLRGNARKLCMS